MIFSSNKAKTPAAPASAGAVVFDVSSADFEVKVLQTSLEKPVIAYFTAPWCGPCKQLGPVIEGAVKAANGAVLLAKINLDENQELAQALRIQSVPTVYAFLGGRPVDAFQGAQPESQVKEFIARVLQAARAAQPEALDIPTVLKAAAQAMAQGDLGTAQGIYAQVLAQDENNAPAYVGLVRVMIAAGQVEQAEGLVKTAPEEISKTAIFGEARTALDLARAKPAGSTNALAAAVEKNPTDHQARYDLALAQFTSGLKAEGMESLLEILRRQRDWKEEEARKQLLKFFEALGPADPLTLQGRKKLSAILFS